MFQILSVFKGKKFYGINIFPVRLGIQCVGHYIFNSYGILGHGLLWLGMTSGHHRAIPGESWGRSSVNLMASNTQGSLKKPKAGYLLE